MTKYATLNDIKQAVAAGATVYWQNRGYVVAQGPLGWEIRCTFNGSSDPLNEADYTADQFIGA